VKLRRARISNFKSVLDSEWFTLDQLTCLVGKNESGKTAILEGLEKLRSVRPERQDLKSTEYPRINWSEYEESDEVDTAIETEWELEAEELAYLQGIAGSEDLITATTIGLSKDYANKLTWRWPFDIATVAEHAVASSSLSEPEKAALKRETTTELLNQLKEIAEPSQRQTALLADLTARWPQGGVQPTAASYFKGRIPQFVYYSNYDRLPGRVSLNQLIEAQQAGTLESVQGSRVFLALLSMVGSTAEQINSISTSEELISKLEAVQNRLSRQIFAYWSQNKHLKVRFRFDEASPGDPAPFNAGKIFQTRIENTRHEATIRLDERSTGFIWFFSFLVWFSEVQKEFGNNLIVLLDEPGLTLHARAQADLLRYMKEKLVPNYQVIYTTHSPFMIDSSDLTSCRTVEDASGPDTEVLGTKVGDQILSTDRDTLFPLQAALGYDITQTLFVGEHCLLVEGPSDLLYIQWASDALRQLGRTHLDPRWTVTPCGGITKIPSFMSLFGGSRLHVAVLTDFADGEKQKVRNIRDSGLLKDGHVLTAEAYAGSGASEADTEDIVGRPLYIKLVNRAYDLKTTNRLPDAKPAGAPNRVILEVEDHFRALPATVPEFDHFTPSRFLIEHPTDFSGSAVDAALDNFERLFVDANSLLKP
jgi:predicted ATPase